MNQTHAQLDAEVARVEGIKLYLGRYVYQCGDLVPYSPHCDLEEAMRLMEKYRLSIHPMDSGMWQADTHQCELGTIAEGETACIAICKAVIAIHAARQPPLNPAAATSRPSRGLY